MRPFLIIFLVALPIAARSEDSAAGIYRTMIVGSWAASLQECGQDGAYTFTESDLHRGPEICGFTDLLFAPTKDGGILLEMTCATPGAADGDYQDSLILHLAPSHPGTSDPDDLLTLEGQQLYLATHRCP